MEYLLKLKYFNLIQGSYGSWKTWKVMEFRKKNSRPGKSWNFDQSHGKSWKIVII